MRAALAARRMGVALAALLLVGAAGKAAASRIPVIMVTARMFEFSPSRIILRKDSPVVLELRSLDVRHGFSVPALNLRADIRPGKTTRLRIVPKTTGTFPVHCDVFCGEGHEGMAAELVVLP